MNVNYSNLISSGVSYATGAISKTGIQRTIYGVEPNSCAINTHLDLPKTSEPVWILGEKYSVLHQDEELASDLRSRVWITYRRGFPAIDGIGPTSDQGWGCMLRCGQMVLAQALLMKTLGRSWRWSPPTIEDNVVKSDNDPAYYKVLSLFLDKRAAPYSVHQISLMGAAEGKPVGQWFGPNTIAQALKRLSAFDHVNNIVIHVAMDNVVVIDQIKKSCRFRVNDCPDDARWTWSPLLLFIPLRLGLNEVNPIYFKSLMRSFRLKQSLGIIGGRPNHALYFIGCYENQLIYLDPHTTQLALDPESEVKFDDTSYHQESFCRMDIQQMDPSIALCFFCNSEADFENWSSMVMKLLIIDEKQPLFEITRQKTRQWMSARHDCDTEQGRHFCDYDVVSGTVMGAGAMGSTATPEDSTKETFAVIDERLNFSDSEEEFELLG